MKQYTTHVRKRMCVLFKELGILDTEEVMLTATLQVALRLIQGKANGTAL